MPHIKRPVEERFWEKVRKADDPNGCWEWMAGCDQSGYGRFGVSRERGTVLAHRFAWELVNGPVPEGLFLCHKCDNKKCIRQDHMFPGTFLDNARDAARKGRLKRNPEKYRERARKGEDHWSSKLTLNQVMEIRNLYQPPSVDRKKLATQFGVCIRTIDAILRGDRWAWATGGVSVAQNMRNKLTRSDVDRIRQAVVNGASLHELARQFGVRSHHIGRIVNGQRWADPAVPVRRPGRATGEAHRNAKLTWQVVREIRRLCDAGGASHQSIGARFGVSRQLVDAIFKRTTWFPDPLGT